MAGENSVTLAFDLTAVKRLRDLQLVFAEETEWVEHIGILADASQPVVSQFIRKVDVEPDFRSGPGGLTVAVLQDTAQTFPTDRHVLVGTSDDHQRLATEAGWEYRSVEAMAKEHAWRLQYAPPETSATDFQDDDWP